MCFIGYGRARLRDDPGGIDSDCSGPVKRRGHQSYWRLPCSLRPPRFSSRQPTVRFTMGSQSPLSPFRFTGSFCWSSGPSPFHAAPSRPKPTGPPLTPPGHLTLPPTSTRFEQRWTEALANSTAMAMVQLCSRPQVPGAPVDSAWRFRRHRAGRCATYPIDHYRWHGHRRAEASCFTDRGRSRETLIRRALDSRRTGSDGTTPHRAGHPATRQGKAAILPESRSEQH